MYQRIIRQTQRLSSLYSLLYDGSDLRQFISQRKGRSPSSLEEELVSYLPLFDEKEEKEITEEAIKIFGNKIGSLNPADLKLVEEKDPELCKKIKIIGMQNDQHIMQAQFYGKAKSIFKLSEKYEFPARYESLTSVDFNDLKAACLEQFDYGGSLSYRSVLYHLMRNLNNITGEESKPEIEVLAKATFSGKRILELGSGPGFFLYTLRALGSDVTGIETNEPPRPKGRGIS